RAERDALIEFDVRADLGRAADDDARAVIDEEARTDLCAGMYVYAGAVVRVLGHDARHERHTQTVEFVREPVSGNGVETGIAEDDLVEAARGRVAIVSRLHVCG